MREKHLVLDNDYFFAKEQRYRISDIVKLYFYYIQTQKTVNFVAAGIDHDVVVRLYLTGRPDPITVKSLGHFRFGNVGKKASEALISKFNYLCAHTYISRQSHYLAHLYDIGFFVYDGKKIYRNGDVIADRWKFNLRSDRPILKSPFVVFHERKRDRAIFKKTEKLEIDTTFDADVFFGIMANIFDLKWS